MRVCPLVKVSLVPLFVIINLAMSVVAELLAAKVKAGASRQVAAVVATAL